MAPRKPTPKPKPKPTPKPKPKPPPRDDGVGGGGRPMPDDQPPYDAPEGQEWVWDPDRGWFLQGVPVIDPGNPIRVPTPVVGIGDTIPIGEAPPPPPPPPPPVDPERQIAKLVFRDLLTNMGFTTDLGFTQEEIDSLFRAADAWIGDGIADGMDGGNNMLMMFRTSDSTRAIYMKRFPGMKALQSRGQAMSEMDYIQQEGALRDVLRSSGLPSQFYDSFDDYGRFIAGGVSPKEVQDRVTAARSLINPTIAAELQEYYGIGEGMATAFLLGLTDTKGIMLDVAAEARGQQEIADIARNIKIGGMAEASGFGMGRSDAERLSGTVLGQGLDPFDPRTLGALEGTFQASRRIANRERTLAGIDREAYSEMDTLDAAFGDDKKRLASERRAKRERARFSGSAGAASSALGVERNF
jgi:hypothetical protein